MTAPLPVCGVSIGGLTPKPMLCEGVMDTLLRTKGTADDIAAAAARVGESLGDDVMGDIHASADYRRQMAPGICRPGVDICSCSRQRVTADQSAFVCSEDRLVFPADPFFIPPVAQRL